MTIRRCVVPGCKATGDISGHLFACAKHARWLVPTIRGAQAVAKVAVAETVKQAKKEVKLPWYVSAFIEGIKDAS